jgi:hypothetical protein
MTNRQFRFSLRTLLILTALAAAGCYWFARPMVVAYRFVRAIDAEDYAAADAQFAGSAVPWATFTIEEAAGRGGNGEPRPARVEAILLPPTWRDLWRRQRRIELKVTPTHGPDGVPIFITDEHEVRRWLSRTFMATADGMSPNTFLDN